jgi:hypothetical protein
MWKVQQIKANQRWHNKVSTLSYLNHTVIATSQSIDPNAKLAHCTLNQ